MKPETRSWLDLAEEDRAAAVAVMVAGLFGPACFHSQQCAEKALKAILSEHGNVRRIHGLLELQLLAGGCGFPLDSVTDELRRLDRFYTATRYPLLQGPMSPAQVTAQHATEAIADATAVLSACTRAF